MSDNNRNKKLYFTAGPARIPDEVLEQAQRELLDYNCSGRSVMEMSHRSKDFVKIINESETNLRKLVNIPDNYSVLFMHGGAKTQFSGVPMNLCSELGKCTAEYLVNGSWSKMAAAEAEKYTQVKKQVLKSERFDRTPKLEELETSDKSCYRYYCDNETIEGIEYNYVPESSSETPLVCDMTSNFLSRPIDVSKFGVIFAGAQKNFGMAGLTVVIVRNDLLGKEMSITPKLLSYKVMQEHKSLYNTPLTYAIYIANLCFRWILKQGGLEAMDEFTKRKSNMLYDVIDNSDGFYVNSITKENRSRTNVVFLLSNNNLVPKFLEESEAANLYDLKGHRSVGGFRASLFHGITLENVERLVGFLQKFRVKYA